jgi:cytochrome c5
MKNFTRNTALSVLVCALTMVSMFMLPSAFGGDEKKPKKVDGKTLFETKCLKCHKPEKFKEQASDRKGWVLTLSRMQRGTCDISDDELEALADYLAKAYGD